MLVIKHTKVSTIPDGSDPSLVLPSDWNADHSLVGVADVAQGGTGLNAVGPAGTVLTSNGTSMGWQPAGGAGTVTSVALSGGTTGLTVTGSPITTSGTMTLAGTLAIANGGTGQTTTGNAGQALISNGSGSSSWGTPGLASKAYDIMGGVANQILFQNALDSTHYIDAPTTGGTVLGWDGTSFAWVAGGGGSSLTGRTDSATPFLTALGSGALATATGVNNTSMGYQAGNSVSTGNNNSFIGYQSGKSITTGIGNVALGANTFGAASTAQYSVAIGLNAATAGNGSNNIVIGANAGANAATNSNIFLGTNAGNSPAAATAGECIGIGSNSLSSQNSSVGTVAIGVETFSNLGVGGNNTAVGYYAGNAATGGNGLTLIGFNAGKAVTTGNYNTFLGANAGIATTTGARNTGLGNSTGAGNISSNDSTYVGDSAGKLATGGFNTAVGSGALDAATTATTATAIGYFALSGVLTTAAGTPTAVGSSALRDLTTGAHCTAIGGQAGMVVTTGNFNTYVGYQAGNSNLTGEGQTFVGHNAGKLATGSFNTAVGHFAGDGITTGTANCVIGWNAGGGITTGGSNVLLGTSAGANIATGSSNTIIGGYTGISNMTNQTVLSDGTGNIRLQFNVDGAMSFDGNNYGTNNQILRSRGAGATPIWVDESAAPFAIVSTNTTCTSDREIYLFDCTSANLIATLPDASTNSGQVVTIKRFDDNASTQLDVQTTGGQLIDGIATSDVINKLNSVTYLAASSGWHILNVYNSSTPSLASPIVQSTMGGDGDAFVTFTPVEGATGYDVLVDPNGN